MGKNRKPRSLCAVVLVVCLAACANARPEAASLVAAVDRFHRASNDERPARADALALVMCKDKEVCDARASCVDATTATARALRLKHEAEAVLAAGEAGQLSQTDPAMKSLPAKLAEATELLEQGHRSMPACDQKILVLRGRYDL